MVAFLRRAARKRGFQLFTGLYKTFVKDYQHTERPAVRASYGKLAGIVGIILNVALSASKFLVAALTGSLAVAADAVNNLSDASSSVVSLVGFRMSGKPADAEHPFGHARSEYLSGLIVAVLIIVVGVELFRGSLEKVLSPTPVTFSWVTVGVLAASILVKLWMAAFNRATGRLIGSETLIATAADSRNDVITTSAVLVSSLIAHYTGVHLDGWMGLAVAAFIVFSGIGIVKSTLDPLLGVAPDPQFVREIEQHILKYPGVLNTHDLLIHDYGPGRRFGSVHVEVAAEDDALDSHDVIDRIERDALKEFNLHLVVHMDPIVTDDEAIGDLRSWLSEQVKTIHRDLTIHDLRIVPGPTHTNVIFDCVVPPGLNISPDQLRGRISQMVTQVYPTFRCVITFDESFSAVPG